MLDKPLTAPVVWARSRGEHCDPVGPARSEIITRGKARADGGRAITVGSLRDRKGGRQNGGSVGGGDQAETLAEQTIGYLIRDVHRAFSRSLQARIAVHGVSMGQWFFLRALWDEDGLTQRELSHRVGMMEPTTVTALNGMERRGLVARVRNPHDRRKVNIFLTEKGRSLREVLLPTSLAANDQAVAEISPQDVMTAINVLQRMINNLHACASAGGPLAHGGLGLQDGETEYLV